MLALACDFRIAAAGEYNIGVDEVESHAAVRVPSCADGGCHTGVRGCRRRQLRRVSCRRGADVGAPRLRRHPGWPSPEPCL